MKRSKFSLSHTVLTAFNQGQLVPIMCKEVLPGDTFQHATSALIRMSPLNAPVMHPVHAKIHHWYVPTRLIWEDFEDFITGGPDGDDASVPPRIEFGAGVTVGSLGDYFGLPTGVNLTVANGLAPSALPFRAAALIWNEWYRDQDLQTELALSLASGTDATTSTALQNVCWEKDYFTTARPWAQKGAEVTLPLGTEAPVLGLGLENQTYAAGGGPFYESDGTTSSYAGYKGPLSTAGANQNMYVQEDPNNSGYPYIRADLSSATAATINELREAFALQRYKEARARYGSRYVEYLRYLGVRPSDARLQRPEYLGGGKQTVQFSEIIQNAPTTDGDEEGVGNLKGHGIGGMRSNRYRRFFEEHGFVLSFISIQPKTIYAQGLERMWTRATKEDFYQKELQFIGQQEVYNREVYAAHATPNGRLGFQDRYDEYRRAESKVTGEFRTTLNYWHMARIFASDPALNADFVKSNPTNRIYQATSATQVQAMVYHSLQARRMLAKTAVSSVF